MRSSAPWSSNPRITRSANRPEVALRLTGSTIRPVGCFSQFFRNPLAFLFERPSQEDRLAAYVIREHDRGRSLDEILNDRYILNRTTPQQLRRLLENPDLIRALGNDTIESVRTTMTSV